MAEVCDLGASYLAPSAGSIGPALATVLQAVRTRTEATLVELQARLERISVYEVSFRAELAGDADFHDTDPHFGNATK